MKKETRNPELLAYLKKHHLNNKFKRAMATSDGPTKLGGLKRVSRMSTAFKWNHSIEGHAFWSEHNTLANGYF